MGLALDVDTDVAFGIGGGCYHFAIVASMVDYSLGNQRSCVPQLGAVCLAADYHTFDWIYHDAILDVLAGVYVFSTKIAKTRRNEVKTALCAVRSQTALLLDRAEALLDCFA